MARIGLTGTIDASLIERFAGSGSTGKNLAGALRGNATSTSISSTLRNGAQIYVKAVENLNTSVRYIAQTKGTLNSLLEITEKAINLAERAASASTGEQGRKRLNSEFRKLAIEYKKTVEGADGKERDLLNPEDLAEVLELVGLDKDKSASIAEIFRKFVLVGSKDLFADDEIKGARPHKIPPGAFRVGSSPVHYSEGEQEASYDFRKVTNNAITSGAISSVNSVYQATDNVAPGNNPTRVSDIIAPLNGTVAALPSGLSSDVTLRAVNEVSGYSVVESTEDFLGFNSSNFNQLFIVNTSGQVVHQVTANADAALVYGEAAISSDNLRVMYAYTDGFGDQYLYGSTATALGDDPATSALKGISSASSISQFSDLNISNSGNYITYYHPGSGAPALADYNTLTANATLGAETNVEEIGFVGNDQIVYVKDNAGTKEFRSISHGIEATNLLFSTSSYGAFATLESGDGITGYFGYEDTAVLPSNIKVRSITLATNATSIQTTYNFEVDDIIGSISMAFRGTSTSEYEVGLVGKIAAQDSDTELYRLSRYAAHESMGRNLSRVGQEFEHIYGSDRDLLTRPNAYRLLTDLKELKKQLDDNIGALDYGLEIIGKNLDLVRTAGLALLEMSDNIGGIEDAEDAATRLRELIRRDARGALSQVHNLDAITVAALTASSGEDEK